MLVTGDILDVKRHKLEAECLAERGISAAEYGLTVAVQDGTLLLRTGESWGQAEYVQQDLLPKFIAYLDDMREKGVLVGSYISRPRSRDVLNLIRLMSCPNYDVKCDDHCPSLQEREDKLCQTLIGTLDGEVFWRALRRGERSATFLSSSEISLDRYGAHRVCFFYLNVGPEIARVEIPEWVAQSPESLDIMHAILFDQAQRGDGYPRVLIEAHEKAIITAGDRRQFQDLLEMRLANQGLSRTSSQKEISKRRRGL
jgi:hypothetical protein